MRLLPAILVSAVASFLLAATPAKPQVEGVPCNGSPDHSPCPAATPGPASVTTIDGKPAPPLSAPFAGGETLVYEVEWMGIDVGSATTKAEANAIFDGKPAIHLSGSGSSNRAFSLLYSMQGALESWIDPTELYSMGFVTEEVHGSSGDKQSFVMDYQKGLVHRNRIQKKKGATNTYDLDYPINMIKLQDAYSMSYFYRAFPLSVGQKLETDVFTDKKIWKLTVEALARETIKTPAGTFDCIKVKPTSSFNGVPQKNGEMVAWISDDAHRIAVKTQASTPFGKVNAILTKWTQTAAVASAAPAAPTATK